MRANHSNSISDPCFLFHPAIPKRPPHGEPADPITRRPCIPLLSRHVLLLTNCSLRQPSGYAVCATR